MNQDAWEACTDPQAMLDWLRQQGKVSSRKLRLFAVACVHRIAALVDSDECRWAVEVAEQYADGRADREALEDAFGTAWSSAHLTDDGNGSAVQNCARYAAAFAADWPFLQMVGPPPAEADPDHAWQVAVHAPGAAAQAAAYRRFPDCGATDANYGAAHQDDPAWQTAYAAERAAQAVLVRCVFGPVAFRPVELDLALLSWRNWSAVEVAHDLYQKWPDSAADVSVLADLLEEAGCTDADLLGHLRGPGPFVRGDWALDVILGRA